MPLILINPQWTPAGDPVAGPEGCLSFPEIYADIIRPEKIDVTGMNDQGVMLSFRAGGLLARAIQHEYDHLLGVLFIDLMEKSARKMVEKELEGLHYSTRQALRKMR
jgi:peptide deformylase